MKLNTSGVMTDCQEFVDNATKAFLFGLELSFP